MSIGGKTVGADLSIQITTPDGVLAITPDLIGSYSADPESEWKPWLPVTGIEENAVLPRAWTGTIELIRKNPVIDTFWALFEASYYQGNSILNASMLETIKEPDGSITQWMYTGVLLRLTKAGDFRGNEFVYQTLEWRAQRKLKI